MRVVRATDYQDMSRKAANIISAQLILKPDSVLGLSTGSTPEGAYAQVVDLTESTIQANSRNFASADEVPRRAVTIGVQTVMYAHSLLMLASGEAKAQAVRDMCFGPISPECPASILQLHHSCTVLADEAALSLCEAEL